MNRRYRLTGAALLCLLAPAAQAAEVRVTPVRVVLSPAAPIASMHIENAGADDILMQMRVVKWSQRGNEEVFEPTTDVIANPPEFHLPVQGDQIVRFGLQTNAGADEKAYRVFIDQVPKADAAKANQVQTVLRISVPIFIPGSTTTPHLAWSLSASNHTATLRVANSGNTHIEVNSVVLRDARGNPAAKIDRPAYVLPGQTHSWPLNGTAARTGESIQIVAETDQQQIVETVTVADRPGTDAAGHP